MNRSPRTVLALVVAAVAFGWWLGSSPSSPINPTPQRPVLQRLARLTRTAARLGLWVAMSADPPPAPKAKAPEDDEPRQQLVRATRVDADGHPRVDHADGW